MNKRSIINLLTATLVLIIILMAARPLGSVSAGNLTPKPTHLPDATNTPKPTHLPEPTLAPTSIPTTTGSTSVAPTSTPPAPATDTPIPPTSIPLATATSNSPTSIPLATATSIFPTSTPFAPTGTPIATTTAITPTSIPGQPFPTPFIPPPPKLIGGTYLGVFSPGPGKLKPPSVITLTRLQPVALGSAFTLDGSLKGASGQPIAGRGILFTMNGVYLGQTRTDNYGYFQRTFNRLTENAGSYSIVAYWTGNHDFAPTAVTTTLRILPAEVRIQTIPVIAGLPFTMDNQQTVSDQNGVATFKINRSGNYTLNVLVDQYHSTTQQIKFGRWLDESYQPTSLIAVPSNNVIQVGLNVFRLVGQSFLDLDGFPVDPSRISEFMIRSAQGDVFIFHDGQPRWIPSSRIARRMTGLEETKLLYSVISVTIDGSNVVNSSQQRFYTFPTENWPISLLLYSMKIQTRDGLFGFPVGKSVNITYPNGNVVNYPLGKDGSVTIHSLARGTYYTELVGALGMKSRTPVALSRNQDVNTNVLTYLDIGMVGMLGALVALGLLLYGRPGLLFILRRKRQPVVTGPTSATPIPAWGLSAVMEASTGGRIVDYRSLRYESVRALDDSEFKRSVGIERQQFERVLSFLEKESTAAGRPIKLTPADQLLLTIIYFREHPSRAEIAPAFGISTGTVRRTIERVQNSLMNSNEFQQLAFSLFGPRLSLLPAAADSTEDMDL